MIHENIELTGSFSVTGSLTLPNYPSSASHPTPITGSMYNDTGLNAVRFYDGVQWQTLVSGSASGSESPSSSGTDIEYLLVAGGGGGGGTIAGGGGAGGLLSSSLSSIESGSSITVTVGGGGTGGYGWGTYTPATQGENSSIASAAGTSFTTVTSTGGGKGGDHYGSTTTNNLPGDGGSGGGTGRGTSYPLAGGSGTAGQGNDGGAVASSDIGDHQGSGGGGAGATGDAAGADPDGGIGKQSSITGTSTYYAGGGGGGVRNSNQTDFGEGGSGGGGNGSTAQSGVSGTANTGGGGGGGGYTASTSAKSGGDGGSGVAILAYPSSSLSAKGGSTKTSRSDGYVVHTFNSSGTLTVGGANDFPAINNEAFSTVTYTGNGSTQNITTVGFQPDLVWIKNRDTTAHNGLFDSVRGEHAIIYSNLTNAEATNTSYHLDSFDNNGFTVIGNSNVTNTTDNFVAWCWKAGGTAVSAGGTNLTNRLVSANPSAGFSIMTYTGNSSDGTIEHGLTQKPELWIFKNRSAAKSWFTLTNVIDGSVDYGFLDTTDPFGNAGQGDATTTILNVNNDGSSGLLNANGNNYVAYAFHSVDGYQKVGTYTASSGDDVINTGFKPRFVMLKRTSGTGHWEIHDAVRFPSLYDENGLSKRLRANNNSAGAQFNNSPIFFTDTGFTLDSSVSGDSYGDYDANGSTYIYLAIA